MAIRTSREILIEAPRTAVMKALADVDALPSYSAMHKRAEVVDRYPDGRPHHVRVKVRVLGLADTEVLEYRWGPDWLVWDAEPTSQQYAQHVEYLLSAEEDGQATRVRVDVTVEPIAMIPDFLIKRASGAVLDAATSGLRQLALRDNPSGHPE
jgi:uncharacterized protein YndB with AHSA1/START domain